MQIVNAIDVESQLGELLDDVEKDEGASVLIERDRRPAAMLLSAQVAEKAILGAYAHGVLPRAVAMQLLGLDWYGDLLQRMNLHAIEHRSASAEDARAMKQAADDALRFPGETHGLTTPHLTTKLTKKGNPRMKGSGSGS
ncbi:MULTISPECIES: type II toxin-antitoxin system Phd/YefM family antitoxin [Variovorax]|jgi:hypothetical protein|uniref:type II toxin-antitoxin system Phd/YefM family antitoxin n=1 Tax=Variovorax TaxID=34072 RepID=UPI0011603E81|nr:MULTISPECIES: type II toxin-antitoxin system Phd/YefM family antitoxin [unclassified Variovorax]TAJ64812.1 MAG: type II toxin-antitoxin system Phd/YefM family antitoxin [Variovorax sp.]